MFGDQFSLNNIYWNRTNQPGLTSSGGPGQVTSPSVLVTDGLVSKSRSWARQGNNIALIYTNSAGEVRLIETTDGPGGSTWDTPELVWSKGSSFSEVTNPALQADSSGRLFATWVARDPLNKWYIFGSMRETVNGTWSTPAKAAESTVKFMDVHVTSARVDMPTGNKEDVALVCWEEGNTMYSALSPLDMAAFLPIQPVTSGLTIVSPDGVCMNKTWGYLYDVLFAYSFQDSGNADIGVRHANFQTP